MNRDQLADPVTLTPAEAAVPVPEASSGGRLEEWLRRIAALLVAAVAAYASYQHQRAFAVHGGADQVSASLWPLSVDGLLLLASIGLLRSNRKARRRARYAMISAFLIRIVVSLAANIAASPGLGWHPILVAGWPPVALLLAVELLAHRPATAVAETRGETSEASEPVEGDHTEKDSRPLTRVTAEEVMWQHFERERTRGRVPTGAELDAIASTNNYGRAVLRRWREDGRIPRAHITAVSGATPEL